MIVACCQMTLPMFAMNDKQKLECTVYNDRLSIYCHRWFEETAEIELLLPVSVLPWDYQEQLQDYSRLMGQYISAQELAARRAGQKSTPKQKKGKSQLCQYNRSERREMKSRLDGKKRRILDRFLTILKAYNQRQKNSPECKKLSQKHKDDTVNFHLLLGPVVLVYPFFALLCCNIRSDMTPVECAFLLVGMILLPYFMQTFSRVVDKECLEPVVVDTQIDTFLKVTGLNGWTIEKFDLTVLFKK